MKGATLSVLLVALLCGTLIVLQSVPTDAVRVNRNRAPWTSSSVSSASQGSSASASASKSRSVSSSQSTDNDSEGEIESGSSSSTSSSSSSALGQSLPATGSSSRLASTISSSGSGSSVPRSSASSSSLSSASRSVSSSASGSSSRSGSSSASKSSRSSQSKSRSQGRVPKYIPVEDRYPDPSVLADPDDTSSSAEGPMTLASAQGSAKEFMNPSNLAGNPRDTQPEAENKPSNWPKLNQKVKGKPKPKPAVVLVMDNNNQVIRPKKPLPFPKVKGPSKFDQEQVFKNDLAAHHRSVVAQREKYAEQDLKKNKIALKKQAQKPSTQKGDDFDKAAAETGDAKVATAEAIAKQRQLAFEAGLAEKRRAHSEGMKKGQEQLDRMLDKFSADAQRRQQQRSVQLTGLCALGLDCTAGWEDHGSVSMLFSTANWELNPFPPGAAVWRGWRWTNPRLCCATSPEAKIDNLIVLSKHCPAGSTFRGIGGMQLSTDDRSTNPFWPGGSFSGEFFWTHPQYCQVPEQAHLLRRSWCLFAAGSACPAGHGLTQFTDNGMGRVLMRSGDLNKNPFQPSTIQGVPSPWSGDFSKWVNPRICCYDVAGASKANEEIASDSKFSQTSASAEATKASRSLSGSSSSSGSSSRSYSASSSSSSRSASLSASEASESGESGFEGSEESGSAESSRVSESATRSA